MSNVKFEKGAQATYDAVTPDEGTFYHVNEESSTESYDLHKLYIGEHLIGDAFESSLGDEIGTSVAIGGLNAGTTVEDIKKMGVSGLLQAILFEEIWGSYTNPTASIAVSTSTVWINAENAVIASNIATTSSRGTITKGNGTTTYYAGIASDPVVTSSFTNGELYPERWTKAGTTTYTLTQSFASNSVEDISNQGNTSSDHVFTYSGTTPVVATDKVYAYYPCYYGKVDSTWVDYTDVLTPGLSRPSTPATTAGTITFSVDGGVDGDGNANQIKVLVYLPTSESKKYISLIKDGNGYDITNTFTYVGAKSITSDEDATVTCNLYESGSFTGTCTYTITTSASNS